jgi:radical SAM superfamily enzyme YgiQ (UPF0313 family)
MERVEFKTSQLWMASYLDQFYPVTYADFELDIGRPNTAVQIKRYERLVRRYLAEQPFDILAISCWTSLSYQATLTTARICRDLYPEKVIVVGGYHPSARPEEFVTDDRAIDYVITREGELALKEIADNYLDTGRPSEPRILAGPLVTADHFVDYNWDLIESFYKRTFPKGINTTCIYLSRGCPFGCSFCMEPTKERRWRAFSPEEAVNQVFKVAERFDLYSVAIADACFGMRPSWRKEFLKRLVDRRPEFWVVFETRAEYLDAEDVKLLANIKLEIQFGLESGSPEMLRLMKKTKQPEKYLKRFSELSHLLTEHEILHRANMIFNHPGETRKTLDETFAFIDRELAIDNSYLMWANHGFMHFPGCDIDRNQSYYEETFGSRFICGDWWKDDQDQYEHCMRFVPSKDLDGDNTKLWQDMLKARDARMRESLAPGAFVFAARKYYSEWQNDNRYPDS